MWYWYIIIDAQLTNPPRLFGFGITYKVCCSVMYCKRANVKYNKCRTKESVLTTKLFFIGVDAVKLAASKLLQLKLKRD